MASGQPTTKPAEPLDGASRARRGGGERRSGRSVRVVRSLPQNPKELRMPRPVQSPAVDLATASPRSSATSQSDCAGHVATAGAACRPFYPLPGFAKRSTRPAASRNRGNPLASGLRRRPRVRAKNLGRPESGSSPTCDEARRQREDRDDDDAPTNEQVMESGPKLPDGVGADGGLASPEASAGDDASPTPPTSSIQKIHAEPHSHLHRASLRAGRIGRPMSPLTAAGRFRKAQSGRAGGRHEGPRLGLSRCPWSRCRRRSRRFH